MSEILAHILSAIGFRRLYRMIEAANNEAHNTGQ